MTHYAYIHLLRKARERCARDPSCAIVDALYESGSVENGTNAYHAIRKAIGTGSVNKWNAAPGRTHAEVLDAFDKVIATVECDLRAVWREQRAASREASKR